MLQIQQFYNELLKSGRVQKKNQPELREHGLSPRMVQCVHVVLNKALEHAVEEKLILANPAKKCKIPKNTRKEMKILPEALIGPYLSARIVVSREKFLEWLDRQCEEQKCA